MRLAGIIKDSAVNGVGVRDVIFLQGCPHHCVGCQNPHTWSPYGGKVYGLLEIIHEVNSSNNITISGGEPFYDVDQLTALVGSLHIAYPDKTIWIYTGYYYTELDRRTLEILAFNGVEVIVDGRFEEDKKDPKLRFRGSSNQRIIDLEKTLSSGEIVSWEETKS